MSAVFGSNNSGESDTMAKFKISYNKENKNLKCVGFTIAEMMVVLAVIAILAALITPLAVNVITQNRINACIEELDIIKKAIVGDSSLVEGGTRSSFGFVGDIGDIPSAADGLEDLLYNTNSTGTVIYSAWNQDPGSGIWWGWRGPYINEYLDAWGRQYIYTTNTGNPLIRAIIRSMGQDGIDGTSDDISISIHQDEIYSLVQGNTLDNCGAGMACDIDIYTPNGTTVLQIDLTDTTDVNPIYSTGLTLIPIGNRRIVFTAGGISYTKLLFINNGPLTVVNFRAPGTCPN